MSSINFNTKSIQHSLLIGQDDDENGDELDQQFFSISKKYNSKLRRAIKEQKTMDMIYNFRMKTEKKTQKQVQAKEEKSRKSRNFKQGRIFKCGGCSSDYLSYPALYTHIKTKHGGVIPEGTMRGVNGKVKKRGRPKTRRNPQTLYERQNFQNLFPKTLTNLVDKNSLAVLQQYSCERQDDQIADISTKFFVSELREIKGRKQQKPSIKTMSINEVITIFLYNVKDYIHTDTMAQFQQVLKNLINFINQRHHEILKKYGEQRGIYIAEDQYAKQQNDKKQGKNLNGQQKKVKKYCQVEQPRFVPVFVQNYLNNISTEEQEQIKQIFLYDLCRWLHEKKLTNLILMKSYSKFVLNKNQQD